MDDLFPAALVIAVTICFGLLGLSHTFIDYRVFEVIVKQCEAQGYIQNDTTRILCSKEKK